MIRDRNEILGSGVTFYPTYLDIFFDHPLLRIFKSRVDRKQQAASDSRPVTRARRQFRRGRGLCQAEQKRQRTEARLGLGFHKQGDRHASFC